MTYKTKKDYFLKKEKQKLKKAFNIGNEESRE